MTFILAAKDKSGVYIGSDSRASASDHTYYDGSHKLIRIKNFIIGYTASYRTAQIIEFNKDKFTNIQSRKDVFDFVEILKKIMVENGNKDKTDDKNELEHDNVHLILATSRQLYLVYGNYQFDPLPRTACGSGTKYGLGYFDALKEPDMVRRIEKTISATSGYITSVGGKATVWKV